MALFAPIKNTAYTIVSGLGVTNAKAATQTVTTPGFITDRSPVSGSISSSTVPTYTGTAFTYTTTAAHGLNAGDVVTISGVSTASTNRGAMSGTFVVGSVPTTTTFTVTGSATPTGAVSVATGAAFTTADVRVALGTATIDLASPAANTQRYDLIAIDLTTLALATPSTANGLKGVEVASTATPTLPAPADSARYLVLAAVLVSSTDGSTVVTAAPIDVRNSVEYLPVRAFNRSQGVRIGGTKVSTTNDAYVNVEGASARKQLGYHSAIGAVYVTGPLTSNNGDYGIHNGAITTFSSLTATITSGDLCNRITGTYIPLTGTGAQTPLLASGTASFSRTDVYVADKITGAIGIVAGTAAPTGAQVTPAITADKVGIAAVTVDNSAITTVRDLRPRA